MPDLNDLSFFAAVVAHGGVSAASRALGTPKSRISRRLAALEQRLGVRLVERSTRRFKVTEVGQDVYRHARAALSEAEAIDEVVQRLKAEPQGLVRISCPNGIDRLVAGALPPFLADKPRLRLQFMVSQRPIDLIGEGFDIALRVRERLDTDAELQVRIISHTASMLVASPALVAQFGVPAAPADLARLPTLGLTDRIGVEHWRLKHRDGQAVDVALEPRLSASAFPILRQATLDGIGVALLPEYACREHLAAGDLVRLLPEWEAPQGILHLVFPSRRGLLPGVRATIDFLVATLKPDSAAWSGREASLI